MRLKPLALTAALAAMPVAAEACSCMVYDTIDEKIAEIDVAFIGRAEETMRVAGFDGENPGLFDHVTRFSVVQPFKGVSGATVFVSHPLDSAACGTRFEPSIDQLIVARRSDDGSLHTSLCTRATNLRDGKSLLGALRARYPGK